MDSFIHPNIADAWIFCWGYCTLTASDVGATKPAKDSAKNYLSGLFSFQIEGF